MPLFLFHAPSFQTPPSPFMGLYWHQDRRTSLFLQVHTRVILKYLQVYGYQHFETEEQWTTNFDKHHLRNCDIPQLAESKGTASVRLISKRGNMPHRQRPRSCRYRYRYYQSSELGISSRRRLVLLLLYRWREISSQLQLVSSIWCGWRAFSLFGEERERERLYVSH